MPEEATGPTVFYVMKEAVTRDRLKSLRIRVLAEETLRYEDDPEDEEPIECWAIGQAGVNKLAAYGYKLDAVIPTGFEGISFVALSNPDGSPAKFDIDPQSIRVVHIAYTGGHTREAMKELVERELMAPLDVNVEFSFGRGMNSPLPEAKPNTLHVITNGSPEAGEWEAPPEAFGNEIRTGRYTFGEWVSGEPLICPEGEEIGAANAQYLYIYPDLLSVGTDGEKAVLRQLFQQYVEMHGRGFGGEPDYDRIEHLYVTSCSKRADAERRELQRDMSKLADRITSLQQELTASVREGRKIRNSLDNFEKYVQNMNDVLRQEFRNLLKLEKVKRVNWRGDFMAVDTTHMYCPNFGKGDGNIYDIGEFKLVIDHRTSSVKFMNQTRKVRSFGEREMNGPHLFPSGLPCLGTMHETIPRLVSDYQWSPLVQVCLAFIETVNLDDAAGRGITQWPVALTSGELRQIEEKLGMKRDQVARGLGVEFSPQDLRDRLEGREVVQEAAAVVEAEEGIPAEAADAQ